MRTKFQIVTQQNKLFFCLLIQLLFVSTTAVAQNFEQTWLEFLENNKVSNMSELIRPNKATDKLDYAKYLLMNTNTSFCQSRVERAEDLMAEINTFNPEYLHKGIPGFTAKKEDLEAKMKAFHSMDGVWNQFLRTKEVNQDKLESIEAVQSSCEKKTLAKYSYMTAYYHLCEGDIEQSKNIFENRTLRLAEKTTLRVKDVKGLAKEVANMKKFYQNLTTLDRAWNTYLRTDKSPGFDLELPFFSCNPIPNMKVLILNGVGDLCDVGPRNLDKIMELQDASGVRPDGTLRKKIKELEAAVEGKNNDLAILNEAWEAFIPENIVQHLGSYGYEYCEKEALIRAYIMDGFANVCGMAEESLQKIDDLQRREVTKLARITMTKINELSDLNEQYQYNGVVIDEIWNDFVANGDQLQEDFISTENYCDNIQHVKDWVMKGLSGTCIEGIQYLEEIEAFQKTIEFDFFKGLECRVQNLRIKVWDCRHQALLKLAKIQAPDAYEEKLQDLMVENGMDTQRPEECSLTK